jgi:hypothetical protein
MIAVPVGLSKSRDRESAGDGGGVINLDQAVDVAPQPIRRSLHWKSSPLGRTVILPRADWQLGTTGHSSGLGHRIAQSGGGDGSDHGFPRRRGREIGGLKSAHHRSAAGRLVELAEGVVHPRLRHSAANRCHGAGRAFHASPAVHSKRMTHFRVAIIHQMVHLSSVQGTKRRSIMLSGPDGCQHAGGGMRHSLLGVSRGTSVLRQTEDCDS